MLPYALQSAVLILVPLYFIVALARAKDVDRLQWALKVLYSGAFIAYIWMMGRWDLISVYLRYLIALGFVLAALLSARHARHQPWLLRSPAPQWSRYFAPGLLSIAFLGFAVWTVRGYFYSEQPVELAFPLRDGRFYVGQGGNSRIVNYHNVHRAQQYALDIVGLNAVGARARGLYPTELDRYAIFDAQVHSPCEGRIEAAVDGLPDLIPPQMDREHLAGNHVVIACEGALVLLAHLREGSVAVRPGEEVRYGDPLGRVGNSGNTSEPHLHIHAVRAESGDILRGKGVPLLLDGRFAVRNSMFVAAARAEPERERARAQPQLSTAQ